MGWITFGLVLNLILSLAAFVIALAALWEKCQRCADNEPPFCCGRCGVVGEFYHAWELCEECTKEVYGPTLT